VIFVQTMLEIVLLSWVVIMSFGFIPEACAVWHLARKGVQFKYVCAEKPTSAPTATTESEANAKPDTTNIVSTNDVNVEPLTSEVGPSLYEPNPIAPSSRLETPLSGDMVEKDWQQARTARSGQKAASPWYRAGTERIEVQPPSILLPPAAVGKM